MTTVYILPVPARAEDAQQLAALLEACGCSVLDNDHGVAPSTAALEVALDAVDALVVLLTGEEDASAMDAVRAAVTRGRRVHAVRLPSAPDPVPQGVADYADSVLNVDSSDLCRVICGEGSKWEDDTGVAREPPFTPHHKC